MRRYSTYGESELLEMLGQQDERAFAEIYERHWEGLLRHANAMLKDEDEIKDILQDVFVTLWEKAGTIELSASLSAYLHTLVRNRILNMLLRSKVKDKYLASLGHFSEHVAHGADFALREKQMAQCIEEELDRLPEKMREVFELSRKQRLSYLEIAERLQISQNTVKKQISNAIRQLRLKLGIF